MIRIVIVDDTRLYREGLAQILSRVEGFGVPGTADTHASALDAVRTLHPDVVLLRMDMPEAADILRAVVSSGAGARVIALGLVERDQDVIACVEAGALGFLPRDGSLDDLIACIRSAARGETLCSPRMVATLLKRVAVLAAGRPAWPRHAHLTTREHEVVRLIDEGLSNKEIARRLSIEVRTVKNHVHNILEKLQVHRRGEAAARLRSSVEATGD